MRVRKKPVEVEAEQFVVWDFNNVPETVTILGNTYIIRGKGYDRYIEIPTEEGIMIANHLDFIIRGVLGEVYPCKPEAFDKTYELIG